MFGLNCESVKFGRLATSLGCCVGAFPSSYLGLPLRVTPRALCGRSCMEELTPWIESWVNSPSWLCCFVFFARERYNVSIMFSGDVMLQVLFGVVPVRRPTFVLSALKVVGEMFKELFLHSPFCEKRAVFGWLECASL